MIEERLIELPQCRSAPGEENDLEEDNELEILRDHYGITINKRAPPLIFCPMPEHLLNDTYVTVDRKPGISLFYPVFLKKIKRQGSEIID